MLAGTLLVLLFACGDQEKLSGIAYTTSAITLNIQGRYLTLQGALVPRHDDDCPLDVPNCAFAARQAFDAIIDEHNRPSCRFVADSHRFGILSSPGATLGLPVRKKQDPDNNAAVCRSRGDDISTLYIETGWALSDGSLEANNRAEQDARDAGRGLWQTNFPLSIYDAIDLTPLPDHFYQHPYENHHVLDSCGADGPALCEMHAKI